jgi:hypothetical protein
MLAMMQVSGGLQLFNAVNVQDVLTCWMRMVAMLNKSSVAKAYQKFDDHGCSAAVREGQGTARGLNRSRGRRLRLSAGGSSQKDRGAVFYPEE